MDNGKFFYLDWIVFDVIIDVEVEVNVFVDFDNLLVSVEQLVLLCCMLQVCVICCVFGLMQEEFVVCYCILFGMLCDWEQGCIELD